MTTHFDIVVVGGGHAGIEAAHAAARIGCRTLLMTMDVAAIGRLSCNPAMGGLGKGHVVREIDALGGVQAIATDAAGIQFRLLNRSKGPAVQAPRVQLDKNLYPAWVQQYLRALPNLEIIEAMGAEIHTTNGRIRGITTEDGQHIECKALVLTTGTFLDGIMHCGLQQSVGGRIGERASTRLSQSFLALGLETGRLKTGTPCRLKKSSIDFSKCLIQPGDEPAPPMSLRTTRLNVDQVPCWLTRTNEHTHDIIRANLDKSPMFMGMIKGIGPRYCPSIEDKVVRFEEKHHHQIFLEPESRDGDTVYPNGVSTSLPAEVQEAFMRTVPGLENCEFARYGYAVEYTYVPPRQLKHTLETKAIDGLFLAGQINGTSGYEEAGGQGLIAGINAALSVKGEPPLILERDEAYIAVMIDDLLSKEHREPYRLFTSRAEFRLLLRCDNADLRLAHHAHRVGMIDDETYQNVETLSAAVQAETQRLQNTPLRHSEVDWQHAEELAFEKPDRHTTLAQVLSRPEISLEQFERLAGSLHHRIEDEHLHQRYRELVEIETTYSGYFEKQARMVANMREKEHVRLPIDWNYMQLPSLRHEARLALDRFRPETIGQASRLAGVNPADIDILLVCLKKRTAKSSG